MRRPAPVRGTVGGMNPRDGLLDELRRGQDGDPWHGSSASAILADVTAREASARPIASAHTIWEIVLHMTAWRNEVARRLRGGGGAVPEEGDWPEFGETTNAAWRDATEAHATAHRRLVAALGAFPEARLGEQYGRERNPPAGSGVTYELMLHGVAQHDAYHMGQVSLLRKVIRGA